MDLIEQETNGETYTARQICIHRAIWKRMGVEVIAYALNKLNPKGFVHMEYDGQWIQISKVKQMPPRPASLS